MHFVSSYYLARCEPSLTKVPIVPHYSPLISITKTWQQKHPPDQNSPTLLALVQAKLTKSAISTLLFSPLPKRLVMGVSCALVTHLLKRKLTSFQPGPCRWTLHLGSAVCREVASSKFMVPNPQVKPPSCCM